VTGPSQKPLPDNTHHPQEIDINTPAGFEPAFPTRERPQTHPSDDEATGIGICIIYRFYAFNFIKTQTTKPQLTNILPCAVLSSYILVLGTSQGNHIGLKRWEVPNVFTLIDMPQ
jgi:hypothetical protein